MKKIFCVLLFSGLTLTACDNQSSIEKMDASSNDLGRSAKKLVHQIEENACEDSDLECLAKKAKNRTEEGADYIEDKAEEAADKVD